MTREDSEGEDNKQPLPQPDRLDFLRLLLAGEASPSRSRADTATARLIGAFMAALLTQAVECPTPSQHSDNGRDAEVRTADGDTMFVQVRGYQRRDGTFVKPHLQRVPQRRRPAPYGLLTKVVRQSDRAVAGLTDLAVFLAGRKRLVLHEEWRAHLAGESGQDPASWKKFKQAFGFLISAIRYRCSDTADVAWTVTDAVLRSRTLSNVVVVIPTAAAEYLVLRHAGALGVVTSAESTGMIGGTLYGLIRTGRWWRNVKPPEPKARQEKE